ncbi:MAG: indole-3-glycerol phosphate synthase TrpC [Leadbetterella sp.]|nr:indole-3-glycerol phosphate synthase TrpC [Leadbetterella sp.]
MTILDQIIENKKIEVARAKEKVTFEELKSLVYFQRETISLKSALLAENSTGIISEYKRKSPSKGDINVGAGIAETTLGYTKAGAAGISVLTDTVFFGGFKEDLLIAREKNPTTPLLRKDFMIDEYQLFEAKAWGADVILLIAANLESSEIESLSKKAHELGLEVLLEVHDQAEIDKSPMQNVDIVGVNNRNLKNFAENNVNASIELYDFIPNEKVKISESCISHPDTVKQLREIGYKGFLMGENFMKTNNPPKALEEFVQLIM